MTVCHAIRGFLRAMPLIGFFCALLAPFPAHAVPPKYILVANPRIEILNNDIKAFLNIDFDNVTGLYEMLKDGAAVDLVVGAKIERVRIFWTNALIMEEQFVSSLEHNPLTREISLFMPGETNPLLDKNLDRLLAATWNKLELNLGPLSLLDGNDKDTEFRVTLTLSLQHAKVPPWLAKNFMFWSKNVTETETVKLYFRH